jgi:hypothetical protein
VGGWVGGLVGGLVGGTEAQLQSEGQLSQVSSTSHITSPQLPQSKDKNKNEREKSASTYEKGISSSYLTVVTILHKPIYYPYCITYQLRFRF